MLPMRLACLGMPKLFGPDGAPIHLRTRKHLALLIYLAIEPPLAHRRERLAALLWPDSDDAVGRHSLATALSVLRGRLGHAAFDTSRSTVRLVPGQVTTDVQDILSNDAEAMAESVGFLDDFEIPGTIEYAHWVDRVRARLLPIMHERLARRLDQYRRTGNTAMMETLAEQLRLLDPLSEEATRALLEAKALSGERIAALRIFEAWRVNLAEELGATPSTDLERMAEGLRRNRSGSRNVPEGVSFVTSTPNTTPFVGRSTEFQYCYEKWVRSRSGIPMQVTLYGDRGIGKSLLAARVADVLAFEGASVIRLGCDQQMHQLHLGLIRDLIDVLIDHPGAGASDPHQLATLGSLVGRIRQKWPGLPTSSGTGGEAQTHYLAAALGSLIRTISDDTSLVVMIDDIDLADAQSTALLQQALQSIAGAPVFVLLTCTDTGVSSLTNKNAEAVANHLQLLPMTDAESQELLSYQLGSPSELSSTLRKALVRGASGNPSVLKFLVSDWQKNGIGSLLLAIHAMTPEIERTPRSGLPISRSTAPLDQDAEIALALCCILGNRLNDLGAYAMIGLTPGRVVQALWTLKRARILKDDGKHLSFLNVAVRAENYLSIPAPCRRMLHSIVADYLTRSDCPPGSSHDLEIAWHLIRSGQNAEAESHLLSGCEAAIIEGAPQDADIALRTGIQLLSGENAATATLILAESLQELGQWQESLAVLSSRTETSGALEAWCSILRLVAARWTSNMPDTAINQGVNQLLGIAASTHPIHIRMKAVAASIRLLTLSRDAKQISRLTTILGHLSPEVSHPHDKLHLLLANAWIASAGGATSKAILLLRLGVALSSENNIRSSIVVRLLIGLGNSLSVLGQYDKAVEPLMVAESIARQLDNSTLVAECSTQLATAFGRLGERIAQIDWARRASERFQAHDWSPATLGATYELGLGLALEGRFSEAKSVAMNLLTVSPSLHPAWIRQASLLCAADILALSGSATRASRLARAALSVGNWRVLNQSYAGQFARWVAQTCVEDSDPAKGLDVLGSEFPVPESLHTKDRAELQAARACLLCCSGELSLEELRAAHDRLAVLPSGITTTLRGLGLHPDQLSRA